MADDDEDYACHLCGDIRCGCTPEDLAEWRESLKCTSCGRTRSKSMGCPDTCTIQRNKS
jgi:hypothetical protein